MWIISLACKNCGAPLQIKEGMEHLACAHCGAQMYLERGGGAISLQLVEALGSIRTGAAQTAAELALVRLEKELAQSSYRVALLEGEARSCESFRKQDLMSERAVASANDRAVALRSEIERSLIPIVGGLSSIILITGCVLGVLRAYAQSGFFSGLWRLITWGIFGFLAFFVVMIPTAILDSRREVRLQDRLKDVEGQIARHQTALAQQSRLSNSLEQLPDARAELARIQEEITRNKRIVNSR